MISRRLIASCLPIFLCLFVFSLACGCNGSASGNSPLNMVGSWTIHTVSTQGHGSFSGTATVAQSGVGLGKNGATTLTAPIGTIAVSQSGTALNGTLTDSIKGLQFSFIGTLSGGTITITGSTPCPSSTDRLHQHNWHNYFYEHAGDLHNNARLELLLPQRWR